MKQLLFTLAAGLALTAQPVRADDSPVPSAGFSASRYEVLWTKSPFAVATLETGDSSPDYFLVGIAKIEGISYASVIERQNQEHFLISTDKPARGLTLTSILRNKDGSDTYAVVQKDGLSITLKLEQPPATAAIPGGAEGSGVPPGNTIAMPGAITQQIPMPGANLPRMGSNRPFIPRIRRPTIQLPPMPGQQQAVPGQTPQAATGQTPPPTPGQTPQAAPTPPAPQ